MAERERERERTRVLSVDSIIASFLSMGASPARLYLASDSPSSFFSDRNYRFECFFGRSDGIGSYSQVRSSKLIRCRDSNRNDSFDTARVNYLSSKESCSFQYYLEYRSISVPSSPLLSSIFHKRRARKSGAADLFDRA